MRYRVTKTLHLQTAIYAPGQMLDPTEHDLPKHEVDWLLKQQAIEPLSAAPQAEPQKSRGR